MHVKMDRETLMRFIERYKSHTCLWNISSAEYMNKQKRINALQDLVPILGEAATIDSVRKKIDIIRNSYFRQLKKVNTSTSTGTSANNVYTPTLWYYDLMSFLSSEVSRPGTDGFDEPVTEASSESPIQIRRKKRGNMKTQEATLVSYPYKDNDYSKKTYKVNVAKKLLSDDNHNIASGQDNTFGLYINQQLQKLSSDQRTLAEKLMSDVLFMVRTNQLNATSLIVTRPSSLATPTKSERQTSQNSPYSSSHIQYITSPFTQDVVSPPDTRISAPITGSKPPTSQNSEMSNN